MPDLTRVLVVDDEEEFLKLVTLYLERKSTNLKNEFNSYKWAVSPSTGKYTGKPEDKNNHTIDPLRYALRYYHLNYM